MTHPTWGIPTCRQWGLSSLCAAEAPGHRELLQCATREGASGGEDRARVGGAAPGSGFPCCATLEVSDNLPVLTLSGQEVSWRSVCRFEITAVPTSWSPVKCVPRLERNTACLGSGNCAGASLQSSRRPRTLQRMRGVAPPLPPAPDGRWGFARERFAREVTAANQGRCEHLEITPPVRRNRACLKRHVATRCPAWDTASHPAATESPPGGSRARPSTSLAV